MYIAIVPNRSSPPAILLREGYREGGKVKNRTLANLTHWPQAKIDALRRVLRNELLVSPQSAFTIEVRAPVKFSPRRPVRFSPSDCEENPGFFYF